MSESTTKVGVKAAIRLDSYSVISDAIEQGIQSGYRRAFKHTESPPEDSIRDEIHNAIMTRLTEVIFFDEHE